jgi:GNAT superfamily N-acetyltransferase
MIRAPRPDEIRLLPQIENTADRRYARVGLWRVLSMPPASLASLEHGRRRGMLWIAASPFNRVGGKAWLDQLSILDGSQRRGYGAALIDRTATTAGALGFNTLYLSTYRDVPWNEPYYMRRGFVEVPRAEWPRAFRVQFAVENSHGHPPWRRTIMQRRG